MSGGSHPRDILPGAVDGALDERAADHVGQCLKCQAEVAQYRRLARALRSLEAQMAVVPIDLHPSIMRALADAHERMHMWRGALLGAGGLIVAAAGTTAGILLSRYRHRVAS